jgi:HK97 family phage major capsid protein
MTIKELLAKRANLWENAKDFLNTHQDANGLLSAEDAATYDKMEADIQAYTDQIERMQRQETMNAQMSAWNDNPMVTAPGAGTERPDARTGVASSNYADDYNCYLRGRALVHNVLSEGVDANGGYLVPTEFERQIVTALDDNNIVRGMANVIRTTAERKIPVAASHVQANWTAENAAYVESNPTFGQKTLDAFKLAALAKVSIELLQDSAFDLQAYLAGEFGRAFGIEEETAFCVGTGTGQPTGIFGASGGTVGVTAAATNKITADELISLIYALKKPYRRNAQWLMNDSTVAEVRKLKDPATGAFLWQPSMQMGEPDKLLGYSLQTSAYAPAIAAGALVAAFGDFHNFWIADRTGRTIQRLNELYSTNGQVGFICAERLDAKVILPEGIQLLKMKASA